VSGKSVPRSVELSPCVGSPNLRVPGNGASRERPLFGERGALVVKCHDERYYLVRRWRADGKNRSVTIASFGTSPPTFYTPTFLTGDCTQVLQQLGAESVQLVVTSPPYFGLKDTPWVSSNDFSTPLYSQYADLMARAWRECYRVLDHGCRMAVNIADVFTTTQDYGKNICIPLLAEVISGAREVGFDLKNTVIWRKMATCRPSGGGSMMGSWPYPGNSWSLRTSSTSWSSRSRALRSGRRRRRRRWLPGSAGGTSARMWTASGASLERGRTGIQRRSRRNCRIG
jgi:hypothetical protein